MLELINRLAEKNISLVVAGTDLQVSFTDTGASIPDEIIQEISLHKAALIHYLNQYGGQRAYLHIPAVKEAADYAVSDGQRRLWIVSQLEEASRAYNMPNRVVLKGSYTPAVFEAAIRKVVDRHEILRTVFKETEGGELRQVVIPSASFTFTVGYQELTDASPADIDVYISSRSATVFDLEKGPLFLADLIRTGPEDYIFFYNVHHIISDGVSMEILGNEVLHYYHAQVQGNAGALPALALQYKDYAAWQQAALRTGKLKGHQAYWLSQLEGELPVLDLPASHQRPALLSFDGHQLSAVINKDLTEQLRTVCHGQQATLFMGLLGVLNTLFYRYTSQEDIIIGTPVAGREHADLENQIGFYLNTLPLRTRFNGKHSFTELLQGIRTTTLGAYEHQAYPFDRLVTDLGLKRDNSRSVLFDVMMVLQSQQGKSTPSMQEPGHILTPEIVDKGACAVKFDLQVVFTEQADGLRMDIDFNTSIYTIEDIQRLITHYRQLLLAAVSDPVLPLYALDYLPEAEKTELLQWGTVTKAYPVGHTLVDLFKEQVLKRRHEIALVFENTELTYEELDKRSDQLAAYLRLLSIPGGSPVPVCIDRSVDMIVALLGVLKSGCAYVPVDPAYPSDHIAYILKDTACQVVITTADHQGRIQDSGTGVQVVLLSDADHLIAVPVDGTAAVQANDLAYVIYTSGSTGRPKGVMMEHAGVVNRLRWMWEHYAFDHTDVILQKTSFTFDVSVWELFMPLCLGCKMVLCNKEVVSDPGSIADLIFRHGVTCLHFVPPMLDAFMHDLFDRAYNIRFLSSLKRVIASGEALSLASVQKWYSKMQAPLCNLYGPTEAAIDVTYFDTDARIDKVFIGKPVANTSLYVLDDHMRLVGTGVPGELYIGGIQVARGYLNNPLLTASRFVDDPVKKEGKLYRTGDLTRWDSSGNIEYIGRLDNQVKIRGYRIEPGEIEQVMLLSGLVKQAVVVPQNDGSQGKCLVAYLVPQGGEGIAVIRDYLLSKLPSYMVPAYFVAMDSLPVLPNGKINRKLLPAPAITGVPAAVSYAAPANDTERVLLEVYQLVLKRTLPGGVKDSFFESGGDSIKAILLAGKLKQHGYKVSTRDILKYPVLEDMAKWVQRSGQEQPAQAIIEGDSTLTPIQQWLLSKSFVNKHHFNQSVLLHSKLRIDAGIVQQSLLELVKHHDVLRSVFVQDQQRWKQSIKGVERNSVTMEVHDLVSVADPIAAMASLSEQLQASINLLTGPLLKAAIFRLPDGDRLLLIIHHLVVDGVSWRILLEDLPVLYEQLSKGDTIQLPAKTVSFQQWAKQLKLYSESEAITQELPYWSAVAEYRTDGLRADWPEGSNLSKDSSSITVRLNETLTTSLLTEINQVYNTRVDDILLTALAMAVNASFEKPHLLVGLEGHGREEIIKEVDISRTVGWFTTLYPVLLDIHSAKDIVNGLVLVKDQLRKVPNKGIGYGIARYLLAEKPAALQQEEQRFDVLFNYLGDLGAGVSNATGAELFSYAKEGKGHDVDGGYEQESHMTVNAAVIQGSLQLGIRYSREQYKRETVEGFAASYEQQLKKLIDLLRHTPDRYLTPGDLSFKDLKMEDLILLNAHKDVEDVYELSPLQEGIYYHWQKESDSTAYVNQMSFRLSGQIDILLIKKSYEYLMRRHDVLRTSFHHEYENRHLQAVRKVAEPDFHYLEVPVHADKEEFIADYKTQDRKRGFDLAKASQMRLTVVMAPDNAYEFVWSFHHILMDGWCSGILIKEFFIIYKSLLRGEEPRLGKVFPYVNYINWLAGQPRESTLSYWGNYLAGYDGLAEVPFKKTLAKKSTATVEEVQFTLSPEEVIAMRTLCNGLQVTENTFIQSVWGYLLSRYNNTRDVVFGTVVSGRPGELEGIDQMIGLFINTVPVRLQYTGTESVKDLLQAMQQQAIGTMPHHYAPLPDIQSQVRAGGHLFDHIVVFENFPVEDIIKKGVHETQSGEIRSLSSKVIIESNYAFTLQVLPEASGMKISFIYDPSVLEKGSIVQIKNHFENAIRNFVARPDLPVSKIDYLSDEEYKTLLEVYNDKVVSYPRQTILTDLKQVTAAHTAAIAVSYGATQLSYGTLDNLSNKVAHCLATVYNVQPGDLVGILIDRSEWAVVLILGILKAGAAYVPIDPAYPESRIDFIARDSRCRMIIDSGKLQDIRQALSAYPEDTVVAREVTVHDLAYVIYTSGSTGNPKGVMINHGNLYNYLSFSQEKYFNRPDKRYLAPLFTSLSFDLTVTSLFGPLLCGGELVIYPQAMNVLDILTDIFYGNRKINFLKCTPAHIFLLHNVTGFHTAIDQLIAGGEELTATHIALLKSINPSIEIYNEYGPTETTVGTVVATIPAAAGAMDYPPGEAIPIGKAITNTRLYVVDQQVGLLPAGIKGELCIGGASVSKGYLHNELLTARKFMEDPYWPGEQLYRTGDVVSWLPDGNMAYHGRMDDQVKIRGYRVEPGEIEQVLASYQDVLNTAILVHTAADGEKELIAYLVAAEKLNMTQVREYLSHKLPAYMVPGRFMQLDSIPLTVNGKVDKKKLPAPTDEAVPVTDEQPVQPMNDVEKRLVAIWQELLGLKGQEIGTRDNFFELGGHSIKAIKILSRISKEFGVVISIQKMFEKPTIEHLASEIMNVTWFKAERKADTQTTNERIKL
ncbi:amino acid adenylation domain-containing protein [Paraflavitalea soli]|uniref:Amino acid adenylation domain-containing protein n=1 Tax=Paraflavitalea soli TaxID=2315862 RepID=A0A3B7MJD3_9BACT|nr:non-ribosomal peptide synthetase [Paraflavitalea soli]AXY74564.1 amino acid adenylation domain-containing protein [Paraflavitalea soli]